MLSKISVDLSRQSRLSAAELIEKSKQKIATLWQRKVKESETDLPTEIEQQFFTDAYPFLEDLIHAMRSEDRLSIDQGLASHQSIEKINFRKCTLGQLIYRYQILHETVVEFLLDLDQVSVEALRIIRKMFGSAVRNAATRFSEIKQREISFTMDCVPIPLCRLDSNLNFLLLNKASEAFFGLNIQIIGKNIKDVIGEEEQRVFQPYLEKVLLGESVSFDWCSDFGSEAHRDSTVTLNPETIDGKTLTFLMSFVDISERKAYSAKLSAIIESIPDGIIIGDQNVITFCNKAEMSQFGFSHGDVINKSLKSFSDFFDGRDVTTGKKIPTEQLPFFRALQGENSVRDIKSYNKKTGEPQIVRSAGAPIFLNKRLLGAVVIHSDVTRRRSAEEDLKKAYKELYSFFMQSSIAMAVITGAHFNVYFANEPIERLLGRKIQGRSLRDAFTAEELETSIHFVEEVYYTGRPLIGKQVRFRNRSPARDTPELILNGSYHPLRGEGEIIGVLVILQDVTEETLARKKNEESKRRFQEIADSLPQCVWTARSDGTIDWYNRWWYENIDCQGVSEWDDAGSPLHPDDVAHTVEKWRQSVVTGELFQTEYRFKVKHKGGYRWQLGRATPIRSEEGRVLRWVGSNTDIQDQKMAVERLKEERDLHERYVAAIGHDLRTPMTTAKMTGELARLRSDDAVLVKDLSSRIVDSMNRADRMIRDLLDVHRLRAGEGLLAAPTLCKVNIFLKEIIDTLSQLHARELNFVEECAECEAYWDTDGVLRVIENLVGNAVKYGKAHRPITITLRKLENVVELSVNNEGSLISLQDQLLLFNLYHRTRGAMAGRQRGWGIGLTLVKGIVDAHAGRVWVTSEEEKGTTFFVRLPIDLRLCL